MWQDVILGETEDGFGFALKDAVNDLGYQSITTPGTLKAFEEAHRRHGKLPWSRILEPAIALAANGYVWRRKSTITGSRATRPDGSP